MSPPSVASLAQRVAAERGGRVGGVVGYAVRLESKRSVDTRLLFCTTGVLLRRLQDPTGGLGGLTHVVVDEVHERSLDGDFLLIVLREAMRRHPQLRVVLMSATLDADRFSAYFGDCAVLRAPLPSKGKGGKGGKGGEGGEGGKGGEGGEGWGRRVGWVARGACAGGVWLCLVSVCV